MGVGFVHRLAIERSSSTADDDYGLPVQDFEELVETPGLIQPKTSREVELASQAGANVGDHTVYLPRQDVTTEDRLRDITDDEDGPIYQIVGIRDYNFGNLNHLAVDAQRVISSEIPEGS